MPVIRLMMACNDLRVANESQAMWQARRTAANRDSVHGAEMYFVRLQWAHLHEGLKAIRSIADDSVLRMLVDRCDAQTRDAFAWLMDYAPGGDKADELHRKSGQIRDNLTFHYNEKGGKLIRRAIERRANNKDAKTSHVTRGDTAFRWHFKVADDVVDTIIVRGIWKIDAPGNVQEAADTVVAEIREVFIQFVDFAGEFIWRYCES